MISENGQGKVHKGERYRATEGKIRGSTVVEYVYLGTLRKSSPEYTK